MTKPLLTVLIDTCNYGQFIEEAVESVLNQTFPRKDMEIVIVDDGSLDDTSQRIKKYKDEIRYIYQENQGQAGALNTGFQAANGKYIVLLDSDDCCKPDRVEKVVGEFESHERVDVVLNGIEKVCGNDRLFLKADEYHDLNIRQENAISKIVESPYITSSISVRKSALKKILPIPIELKISADLYLLFSLIWFGRLSFLKEGLTIYRIHARNLYHTGDKNKLPLKVKCLEKGLEYVTQKISTSLHFNEHLADKMLLPSYNELKQLAFLQAIHDKRIKRKEFFDLELKRMRLEWGSWGFLYKFYKIMRLPLFFIFPPWVLVKLLDLYFQHKIFKYRNLIFPDRNLCENG